MINRSLPTKTFFQVLAIILLTALVTHARTWTSADGAKTFEGELRTYEIKCRPMKSQASSAFWFYREEKDIWTEIDVFEICGAGGKWHQIMEPT